MGFIQRKREGLRILARSVIVVSTKGADKSRKHSDMLLLVSNTRAPLRSLSMARVNHLAPRVAGVGEP